MKEITFQHDAAFFEVSRSEGSSLKNKNKKRNRIDVVCTLEREVGELHKLNLDTRLKRAAQKGDKINVEGDCTTATISG